MVCRIVCLVALLATCQIAVAKSIVTLSPHLTEWVYSLGQQNNLLAVSAYSDYPDDAARLPTVADANGVNIKAIVKLNPDIILAWRGGNKPQDIARLKQLGFAVFESGPKTPSDISKEFRLLGPLLGVADKANRLADDFDEQLTRLFRDYQDTGQVTAFYYMWKAPLMSVGPNAWASQLLARCQVKGLFDDARVDYPQVSVQEVIRRKPAILIAATQHAAERERDFWSSHRAVLDAPIVTVNPDIFSRFTLRLVPELRTLCKQIHQTNG